MTGGLNNLATSSSKAPRKTIAQLPTQPIKQKTPDIYDFEGSSSDEMDIDKKKKLPEGYSVTIEGDKKKVTIAGWSISTNKDVNTERGIPFIGHNITANTSSRNTALVLNGYKGKDDIFAIGANFKLSIRQTGYCIKHDVGSKEQEKSVTELADHVIGTPFHKPSKLTSKPKETASRVSSFQTNSASGSIHISDPTLAGEAAAEKPPVPSMTATDIVASPPKIQDDGRTMVLQSVENIIAQPTTQTEMRATINGNYHVDLPKQSKLYDENPIIGQNRNGNEVLLFNGYREERGVFYKSEGITLSFSPQTGFCPKHNKGTVDNPLSVNDLADHIMEQHTIKQDPVKASRKRKNENVRGDTPKEATPVKKAKLDDDADVTIIENEGETVQKPTSLIVKFKTPQIVDFEGVRKDIIRTGSISKNNIKHQQFIQKYGKYLLSGAEKMTDNEARIFLDSTLEEESVMQFFSGKNKEEVFNLDFGHNHCRLVAMIGTKNSPLKRTIEEMLKRDNT